jgi:hypothetical protein
MRFEALFTYGSTLSPLTRKRDSRPDHFAIVSDLGAALRELGHPLLARVAKRMIQPITVAHDGGKLSLITREAARRELGRDLYLAGRLSKKLQLHHGDIAELIEEAAHIVVEISALDLPRQISIEEAVLRCLAISYRAEVRPENERKPRALYDAFPDFYLARFAPLVEAHARSRGLEVIRGSLIDRRASTVRSAEAKELHRYLLRCRWRSVARWPQQLMIFRGSIGYVLTKLRRSWA